MDVKRVKGDLETVMSTHIADHLIGQRIRQMRIDPEDNVLTMLLENGALVNVWDRGQQCCETRYMATDDPLDYFIGGSLYAMELRSGPSETTEYGDVTESQFLLVMTSKGTFTIVNYNSHNGYYGGFDVVIDVITKYEP